MPTGKEQGTDQSTQALLPGSVAIDAGDDPRSLMFDHRGAAFLRVVGGGADIGAFEYDDDRIFSDGFE